MVESHNQQQISRWFRYHLYLSSPKRQLHTEWGIQAASKRRIIFKSNYADLIEEFGVSKITLFQTPNVLSTQPKFNSMKHLYNFIAIRFVKKERVREGS